MNQINNTDQIQTSTNRTSAVRVFTLNEGTLRRITGLIQLGFGVLNGMIGLRFLLKLMAANPQNPFASLIYFITQPFLWMFQGLTRTPSFEGIEVEFFSLIAIVVYGLLGWIIIQLIWILFARMK
ncbi:MAG: YggT family protein [Anaerolineales bacterium]|nr:YggT family protein [Anaerolineales bacterium]WKZ42099.1 MAG: YggT family protein [Anaerolineales bacterium]